MLRRSLRAMRAGCCAAFVVTVSAVCQRVGNRHIEVRIPRRQVSQYHEAEPRYDPRIRTVVGRIFVCETAESARYPLSERGDDTVRIRDLIAGLPVTPARGEANLDVDVCDITEDSRTVRPGAMFVARPGLTADGRAFIDQAVEAGAAAFLCDDASRVSAGAVALVADDVPYIAAALAERFCGNPSRKLTLIGVTGTNGKTTTTHLIHQMLTASAAREGGDPAGLIGTIHTDTGRGPRPSDLTTPPAMALSRLMREMLANNCRACVMECSSHALDQQRVVALAFDVAIFTNLSGDHMDYHGSADAYIRAKAKLFAMLSESGTAIVNADDPVVGRMIENCAARILRCSLHDHRADFFAEVGAESIAHIEAKIHGPWGKFAVHLPLCGRHNVMNALQAAAACQSTGMNGETIRTLLARCTAPPGRLEPVTTPNDPFAVYVDYAHTDDALENVLHALKPLVPSSGRLHVVFGCGGDRDRTKRPRMASVAARYGDRVYVTSDNPRTEDPQQIIDEVMAGIPPAMCERTVAIVDRREAIHTAIRAARSGDVVLIAGKGHEDYQIIGREKRPFDDRLIARDALNELREPQGAKR
jgi:UDP-N-acetylmuramoyl-L-alanyl-D-glutamate--2,6-diaminopimelate ligase